jgi:lysophospholipase L1-like esterase
MILAQRKCNERKVVHADTATSALWRVRTRCSAPLHSLAATETGFCCYCDRMALPRAPKRSVPKIVPPAVTALVVLALGACSADRSESIGTGGATNAGSSATAGTTGTQVGGAGGLSLAGSAGDVIASGGVAGAGGPGGGANSKGGSGFGGSGGAVGGGNAAGAPEGGNAGAASAGASSQAGGGSGTAGIAGAGNAFSPCPTSAATPCAVLPLGDSITEGFGSSGGGYRVELFRQAVQNGKNLTFVGSLQNGPATVQNQPFPKRHQGHGGYTIDTSSGHSGISGSITEQALANYRPNIVLLMIGTNDINGNVDVAAAPTRLGKLIDAITTRAPDALLVVATIIPIANDGTNPKVQAYNAALPALVNARANAGKHVVLLDNYAAFVKDPSYRSKLMGDYLHPNDAGYAVLGRAMYEAIGGLLPS